MKIELTTTDVAHGGYCVARHDGMVVFVLGALPGERVVVEITEQKSRMWFGRVVEVLQASADRVPHVWALAERTGIGGIDLGHVSLVAGRRWKAQVIETQLARLAHVTRQVDVEAAPGDEQRGGLAWRTRVEFQVDGRGRLGMYAAKSHQVVPVDGMPLAHEDIQADLAQVIASGGRPDAAGRSLTYVRPSASELVTVVGAGAPAGGEMRGGRPRSGGEPRSRRSGRAGELRLDQAGMSVEEVVSSTYGTWSYEVAANGFWQVHREAPHVLVTAVLDAVDGFRGPAWDLYCGAGLFTLPLAQRLAHPVTAVEGSPVGVEYLKRNVAGLDVHVIADDVTRALSWAEPMTHGVVVCDPPRSGAGRTVVSQIARLAPDKVIYVACDPAAFARDVALFADFDYELTDLRAFDLFPLTHHVECVGQLVRR